MPIELYVGPFGSGKSFAMVKEAMLPCLKDNRWHVLSNLHVTHPKTGRQSLDITDGHGHIDFPRLMRIVDENVNAPPDKRRNLLLAIDEVGATVPVEMWRSKELEHVIALVLQTRKVHMDIVGTTQQLSRVAKPLRDNCAMVHVCRVLSRTWFFWHRDRHGPINRKTGNYYRLVWLFQIESLDPDAIHLSPDSPRRRQLRDDWRNVRFEWTTARAYDTYQRQAYAALGEPPRPVIDLPSPDELDDQLNDATRIAIESAASYGELTATPAPDKPRLSLLHRSK